MERMKIGIRREDKPQEWRTPIVPAIGCADYDVSFEQLDLPPAVKDAVIVHRGELTPKYRYLERHLSSSVPGHSARPKSMGA